MKNSLLVSAAIVAMLAFSAPTSAQVTDPYTAEGVCQNQQQQMLHTAYLHQNGVPYETSREMILNSYDIDPDLYTLAVQALDMIYDDNPGIVTILESGEWASICAQNIY